MLQRVLDNIYKIDVPMRDGALNCLNAYFIQGERNLLIDTGFDREESYKTITGALNRLETSMENTDIFLTHMHPDHAELAGRLAGIETRIYIGEKDAKLLNESEKTFSIRRRNPEMKGFPPEVAADYERTYALRRPFSGKRCTYTEVLDGDILEYGGYRLRCIDCAGHSPGQTCLYIEEKKLLFCGDHILFDITPNVSSWEDDINPLKDYIKNLEKLKAYDIEIVLPAHRGVTCSAHERIDEIIAHHNERLDELLCVLKENGELNTYEIASRLTWNTPCNWRDMPTFQKYSAVGEVVAHLAFLLDRGLIEKRVEQGVNLYSARAGV
mgnify:CR=1 FL=1|jgi:glyoxylase-like metal-dependent hydrolase (beta-lactamase superfamily II)